MRFTKIIYNKETYNDTHLFLRHLLPYIAQTFSCNPRIITYSRATTWNLLVVQFLIVALT